MFATTPHQEDALTHPGDPDVLLQFGPSQRPGSAHWSSGMVARAAANSAKSSGKAGEDQSQVLNFKQQGTGTDRRRLRQEQRRVPELAAAIRQARHRRVSHSCQKHIRIF